MKRKILSNQLICNKNRRKTAKIEFKENASNSSDKDLKSHVNFDETVQR